MPSTAARSSTSVPSWRRRAWDVTSSSSRLQSRGSSGRRRDMAGPGDTQQGRRAKAVAVQRGG
eukprot:7134959-Pyramimonas_sp.AAC.1